MDNTLMKLKLLARTESTLLRLQAQRTGKQIVFLAVAVGMVLLTVVMLNVGTFELLAEYVGKAYSAFIMAGANALLATVLVVLALTLKPGREEQMAREIREMVVHDISSDAEKVKEQVTKVSDGVRDFQSGLSSFSSGIYDGLSSLASLGPLITSILELIRRRKS